MEVNVRSSTSDYVKKRDAECTIGSRELFFSDGKR